MKISTPLISIGLSKRLGHIILLFLAPFILLAGVFVVTAAGINRLPVESVEEQVDLFAIDLIGHIGGPANSVDLGGGYAFVGFSNELAVMDITGEPDRVGYILG